MKSFKSALFQKLVKKKNIKVFIVVYQREMLIYVIQTTTQNKFI